MVEGLIGKKIGMSQIFDHKGNVIPLTVIKVGPCTVIQKKTEKKDGYSALQLGLVEEKGMKKPTKPVLGHFKKAGVPPVKILREFRFKKGAEIKEGDQILVDIFQEGEKVHVTGTSKGKGFASVIKRWGFRGGKASHGSMFHRAPGSIGASAFPSRVFKGKKLPGHMGHEKTTVKNLTVVQADQENNFLIVKGSIPGASSEYLLVKKASFDIHAPAEKKQVTEEKKPPEEKKIEEKKPEEKKLAPEEKKPAAEDKKPIPEEEKKALEEKKPAPEEKKPEEEKLEGGKPEEKKPEEKKLAPEEKKSDEEKQASERKKQVPEEKKE